MLTFGIVTIRWPVVWDLLAVLVSGETSSDKASWKYCSTKPREHVVSKTAHTVTGQRG